MPELLLARYSKFRVLKKNFSRANNLKHFLTVANTGLRFYLYIIERLNITPRFIAHFTKGLVFS